MSYNIYLFIYYSLSDAVAAKLGFVSDNRAITGVPLDFQIDPGSAR